MHIHFDFQYFFTTAMYVGQFNVRYLSYFEMNIMRALLDHLVYRLNYSGTLRETQIENKKGNNALQQKIVFINVTVSK